MNANIKKAVAEAKRVLGGAVAVNVPCPVLVRQLKLARVRLGLANQGVAVDWGNKYPSNRVTLYRLNP